jgi:pimeloyl-ACP methyl ester carboxylesterase
VLLLHGFPEIWFYAIALDFRGYGLFDQPSEPMKAAYYDLVEGMASLLDALSIEKGFVVRKDFGAAIVYYFDLCHSHRVKGIVTLGVPYIKTCEFTRSSLDPAVLCRSIANSASVEPTHVFLNT